jgi:hypothetical protein
MWIFPAGFWPVCVDTAVIVVGEKGAWARFQNVILVLIYPKVLFDEIPWFHAQRLRHPFDVILVENGTGCFATIGTLQAIDFVKYFPMELMKPVIYLPGIFPFQALEKFPVLQFFILRQCHKLFLFHPVLLRFFRKYRKTI